MTSNNNWNIPQNNKNNNSNNNKNNNSNIQQYIYDIVDLSKPDTKNESCKCHSRSKSLSIHNRTNIFSKLKFGTKKMDIIVPTIHAPVSNK